ncbi:MAG: putative molybdenum carrier protein [Bacteroidales bacterium]|nr:putative molybdenum carrier protein [Bacteroidales bacterium]MCF6342883.1 putative molybdenum carrier protein [Bacteroidales bacterium]
MNINIKIVSGGQSGVDRAALDFALENNIGCGGWCPKGRVAEDGRIHPRYPLRETTSTSYRVRTRANVADSDGTLILYFDNLGNGTLLTQQEAIRLKKPCLLLRLKGSGNKEQITELISWLETNSIATLNIAGPRESSMPGIYAEALTFLRKAFFC